MMKKIIAGAVLLIAAAPFCWGQLRWQNVDSLYGPLPSSIHIYKSTDTIEGKPNIAFYVIADLKDRKLNFTTDTTFKRRLTPKHFYDKNLQPLIVVNGTFFDFATNRNLNTVIKDGKLVSYNVHTTPLKGKDTLKYLHRLRSAIGISKRRKADVSWIYTDSLFRYSYKTKNPGNLIDSNSKAISTNIKRLKFPSKIIRKGGCFNPKLKTRGWKKIFHKWKVQTAIGGGPVLIHDGNIRITNNEEWMFTGKAINDKHPRTAMGYTSEGKLIILVVQGRFPNIAEGASLNHLAAILLDLGCVEALNLDGGGSSCLLVNGKETIQPSDQVQRAVPAVFIIQAKKR